MDSSVLKDLDTLAANSEQMKLYMQMLSSSHWWNTNWFASLIGAVVGASAVLLFGGARDYLKNRQEVLRKWYLHIVDWRDPNEIYKAAYMTSYGVTDKPFSEKILIEFRSKYKYWNLPWGRLRYLLGEYEQCLRKIPDVQKEELENTVEYKEGKKVFQKIVDLAEARTGENQWTV